VLDGACPVLDTGESSFLSWIPAFAGMTLARQASGNGPEEIQYFDSYPVTIFIKFSSYIGC
jgi:hypothetical protein